jgi:hypothetical protein
MRKGINEAVEMLKAAKSMGLISDISISPIYYIDGMAAQETVPALYRKPNVKITVTLHNDNIGETLMHHILDNYTSQTKKMQVYIPTTYQSKNVLVIECLFSDLELK